MLYAAYGNVESHKKNKHGHKLVPPESLFNKVDCILTEALAPVFHSSLFVASAISCSFPVGRKPGM